MAVRNKIKTRSGNGHRNDGAEDKAKLSGGRVKTAQVRILEALATSKHGLTRMEIKKAVGHWPKRRGYHRDWINTLRQLSPELVCVTEREPLYGEPHHFVYTLTTAGRALLKKITRQKP